MTTMATSHRSAGVLSDWCDPLPLIVVLCLTSLPHRNRLEDAPARRTRAVGETCRAGTCRAPRAISRLALPAWHQRRRYREAQGRGQERGQTSCTAYMPRHLEAAFNGALVQARVLPARASLKTLCVREALVLRETSLNVSVSLAVLPALTFLTIAFRLEQGYHNSTVLRTIVAACPHLRQLDFFIACCPSFTIVSAPSLPSHPPSPTPEECLFIWCSSLPGKRSRGSSVRSATCAHLRCASCGPRAKTTSAYAALASCAQAHG
jgi:hypothetical protein